MNYFSNTNLLKISAPSTEGRFNVVNGAKLSKWITLVTQRNLPEDWLHCNFDFNLTSIFESPWWITSLWSRLVRKTFVSSPAFHFPLDLSPALFPWNCACPSRVGLVFHCKIDSFSHRNILNLCQCEDELGLQKLKLLTGNMEEKS